MLQCCFGIRISLGCVNVPKVIKCMFHGAQLMSLVINDSPSEKNLKILHFLIWIKAFEDYLLAVCSGCFLKKKYSLKNQTYHSSNDLNFLYVYKKGPN